MARKSKASTTKKSKSILAKISPLCDARGNCVNLLWSLLVFGVVLVAIGLCILVLTGAFTGVSIVSFDLVVALGAFGWVSFVAGIIMILLWLLYFFGVIPSDSVLDVKATKKM